MISYGRENQLQLSLFYKKSHHLPKKQPSYLQFGKNVPLHHMQNPKMKQCTDIFCKSDTSVKKSAWFPVRPLLTARKPLPFKASFAANVFAHLTHQKSGKNKHPETKKTWPVFWQQFFLKIISWTLTEGLLFLIHTKCTYLTKTHFSKFCTYTSG